MLVAQFPLAVPYLLNPVGIVALVTLSGDANTWALFGVVLGVLVVVLGLDFVVFRGANRISKHLDEGPHADHGEGLRLSAGRARRPTGPRRPVGRRRDPPVRPLSQDFGLLRRELLLGEDPLILQGGEILQQFDLVLAKGGCRRRGGRGGLHIDGLRGGLLAVGGCVL